ncbi:MAG: phenylalanine--tRNA ligase subunit beta [Propionibacteriaceae bacterium]|jgi:phenylalanyl-tRNA synthetase beta chain|nr:phenylalanine--tRNA ligase subunit beta [Propionibacteriaceae bacterium]
MRVPYTWLAELAELPAGTSAQSLAPILTDAGLQVEKIEDPAAAISGPVVVGKVLDFVDEPQKNGKIIRWCHVDVGDFNPSGENARGIICGAHNFEAGDYVCVALSGTVLPGGFAIAARKTYGHISDGMICAEDELGLGEDHTGIIVLPREPAPVVGSDALALLGARDAVYEIDVTPDEGYCLSMRGIAREAAQLAGGKFTDPYGSLVPADSGSGYPVVLESEDCPLFVGVRVHGVDPNAPSPDWMKKRLAQVGMRSISCLVDITNYVMMESGQPLHAYDATTLHGPIRVRKAHLAERLTTLDHQDRALSEEDLLITDDSGPIGLAGVMGGLTTELAPTTTEIFIEAAWFAPATIGRTYRRHRLPSEASKRFERGVDMGVAYAAALRCAELLRDLAGGTIDEAVTVAGEVAPMAAQTIPVDLPARILGVDVPADKVIEILTASGVEVTSGPYSADNVQILTLTPPTWRRDLVDPYDYVEEVGRKLGFRSIVGRVPVAPLGHGYTWEQKSRRLALNAVAGAGFVELITLPFLADVDLDKLGLADDDPRRAVVTLANPLSDAQPYLRTTLLPGLFAAVNRNTSRSIDSVALFECGSVFRANDLGPEIMPAVSHRPSDEEIEKVFTTLPDQPRHLAAVVAGDWLPSRWDGKAVRASWEHVVGCAQVAAAAVGMTLSRRVAQQVPWHPGRCAELGFVVDEAWVSLGFAGELHPSVIDAWGLPKRACAMELDFDALLALAPHTGQIRPLSTHPATKQDVALIVDASVASADVQAALVEGAGDLLESIALFDIYVGAQVGEGKKSLAYNLVFRAPDRTLTEDEASAARDSAVAVAATRYGAVMRTA